MTDTETEAEEMTPATSEENVEVDPPLSIPKRKHSSYDVMIRRAISALQAKCGSSKKAITRYILDHNPVKKHHALDATVRGIKRMLRSGRLYKDKVGRFKLAKDKKRYRTVVRRAGRRGGNKGKKGKRRRKGRKMKRRRKGKPGKKRRKQRRR